MAAGGLATSVEAASIVKARRLSRTAAEMLQGVRCGLNAAAAVIGTIDSKQRIDMASASLFEGLSRSRPGRAWPIYRWSLQGIGSGKPRTGGKAISKSTLRPLLPDLSSPRIETLGEERTIALLTRDLERDRLLRTLLVELLMSEGFRIAEAPIAEEPSAEEGGE